VKGHASKESELLEMAQLHLRGSFQAVKDGSMKTVLRTVYPDIVRAILVFGYHAKDACI